MATKEGLGALATLQSAYSDSEEEEEESRSHPHWAVKGPQRTPLDFKSVGGGCEDVEVVAFVSKGALGALPPGKDYTQVRIKEEPLSSSSSSEGEESDTADSDPDSASSSSHRSIVDLQSSSGDESEEEGAQPQGATTPKKKEKKKKNNEGVRVKGELTYDDLPRIEELKISVEHEKCVPIGVIKSFVDPLVIVESYEKMPALNIDSVLFLDEGDRALGHVFDVFGRVSRPSYCVRFNSLEHINENKIKVGAQVYAAYETEYADLVLPAQIEAMRRAGRTDASWEHDLEPPPEVIEFSDDEAERAAKRKAKRRGRKGKGGPEEGGGAEGGEPPPQVYLPSEVPGFRPMARPHYRTRGRGTPPNWNSPQYYPRYQGPRPPPYYQGWASFQGEGPPPPPPAPPQFQPGFVGGGAPPPRFVHGAYEARGRGGWGRGRPPPRWNHPPPNWSEPSPPGC